MWGPRLIHLWSPLSPFLFFLPRGKTGKALINVGKPKMTILTVQSTVTKKLHIITRVPNDHCACCYLWRKKFNHTNCENCAWPAGIGWLISKGQSTENATVELFEKTHGLHFCSFHICLFLSVVIKTNHTAHMYGCIKTLKHNVETTLRLAYHDCKNLTRTNKTRHLKRTQLVELLGSRFACLLLFQTAKNRTQRNRRAKWCEVQIRTVARKSSIRG